jgi:hypothetical protein
MQDKQNLDWSKLMAAADQMEHPPVCENYPDAFFPEKGSTNLRAELIWAKETCQACPIKLMCGEYGMRWEEYGIWGGLTAEDRRKLKSAVRRAS